jgi:hypothetical protein
MKNQILEFINRRFKDDCSWVTGNCYYFSIILKDRFPEGTIYYDVINGHFVFWYDGKFYDWTGTVKTKDGYYIAWDVFDKYDSLEKERIIRDCVL